MHVVPAHQSAVTLFSHAGEVECFPSLKAALRALGLAWIRQNVGPEFRVFSHVERRLQPDSDTWHYRRCYDTYAYVMRNDAGEALTAADFFEFVQKPARRWGYRIPDSWNGEGPVPGIRAWRSGGHYFRRIRTTQERRWATPVAEEGEPAPRPERNLRNLPNSWDDYGIAARADRNWKRFRRQQWKA